MSNKDTKTKEVKQYNVKPKPKHRQVVKNLVENGWNKNKALLDAGYSKAVADNPSKVTESRSFQLVLNEAGISLDDINKVFAKDLHDDKKRTIQHIQTGYKLHGKLREDKQADKTLILITTGETASRYNLNNNTGDNYPKDI